MQPALAGLLPLSPYFRLRIHTADAPVPTVLGNTPGGRFFSYEVDGWGGWMLLVLCLAPLQGKPPDGGRVRGVVLSVVSAF